MGKIFFFYIVSVVPLKYSIHIFLININLA